MEVKFTKKLSDYDYLVMFDLASKASGICVWDLRSNKPAYTSKFSIGDGEPNKAAALVRMIDGFFVDFAKRLGDQALSRTLVYRELCPMQQGRFTTAKTLIALGKAHASLDIYLEEKGLDYYDLLGVAPATTHSYFRKIKGLPPSAKVEKTDVRDYLISEYGVGEGLTLDETDAVFLAKTFVEVFWNKDLDEAIREKKRHMKTLKAANAIERTKGEIEALSALKV